MDNGKTLKILSYILLLIGAFLSINYSKDLGLIYAVLTVSIAVSVLIDKNIEYPLYKEDGWLKSILWGIGGYIILALVSTLILQGIFAAQGGSFIQVLSSSIPIFANSGILTAFSYVFFVGTIETVALLRINELINNGTKSNFKWGNPRVWFAMILTLGFFAILHATSKDMNLISLLIVGIMMGISIIVTLISKDMRAAIFIHWIANGLAVLFSFHVIPDSILSMLTLSFIFITIKNNQKIPNIFHTQGATLN